MSAFIQKFSIGAAAITLLFLSACAQKSEIPLHERVGVAACSPEPGSPFQHRKVVQVVGTTGAPELPRDLPGLARLTSTRLQMHLEEIDRFQVLATHDTSFPSMTPDTISHVRQLGRKYASQFLVKIELLDMTLQSTGGYLSQILGSDMERNVHIKLYVFDTDYGALFHSRLFKANVKGDVMGYPGSGSSVSTSWFETDLGKTVDIMLKNMSHEINEQLACVPFSTRITAIKGQEIHFGAGHLHGIRPGETMRVYKSSYILLSDGSQELVTHKQEDDAGWITIDTVYPNHSVARAVNGDAGSHGVNIGDVVRAW